MKNSIFSVSLVCLTLTGKISMAQFAPGVGVAGTSAMYKDSTAFVRWATSSTVVRGYQDISVPANGYTNVGDDTMPVGKAGTNAVVSLGDGGYAIMQFTSPIVDASGPDLAVFENGFDNTFLELAFVEVSSDGVNFFRFPAISNTDTTAQTGSFGPTDATKINNLAGKYKALYGTPFDISDIADNALLNKLAITHVKVIDVVGCIQSQYCTRDANNHKVNDPWPTAFGSGGFDLDAVGVIHDQLSVGLREFEVSQLHLYPNPAKDELNIMMPVDDNYSIKVYSGLGQEVINLKDQYHFSQLNVSDLTAGIYFITIDIAGASKTVKFIKLQ